MCGIVGLFLKDARSNRSLARCSPACLDHVRPGTRFGRFRRVRRCDARDDQADHPRATGLRFRGRRSPAQGGRHRGIACGPRHPPRSHRAGAAGGRSARRDCRHARTDVVGSGRRMEIYKEVGRPDQRREALRPRRHDRHARASAIRAWRPNPRSPPTARIRSRPAPTSASSTTARCRTTMQLRRELIREGLSFRDRERHRSRRRLSELAAARRRLARADA